MRFSFEEIYLLKAALDNSSKTELLDKLAGFKAITKDEELWATVDGLQRKIEKLSDSQIRKMYEDKMEGKLNTMPQYGV